MLLPCDPAITPRNDSRKMYNICPQKGFYLNAIEALSMIVTTGTIIYVHQLANRLTNHGIITQLNNTLP